MSEPKHTPGPYNLANFDHGDERGIVVKNEKNTVLAWIFTESPNSFGKPTPTTLPALENAKLFAAAPDMYHVLSWFVGAIEENPDYAPFKNLAYDRLNEALKKAKGD